MTDAQTVVRVLCCDDDYDEDTFDKRFEDDWERRRKRNETGRLQRYGTVRASVRAAQGALTTAASHSEMPAVVLIDDWLSVGQGRTRPGAFELLRWIESTFEPSLRPSCVLMTGRFDPLKAHAFCEWGGIQAIDKVADPWQNRTKTIWDAVAGIRWHHTPNPPRLKFTARDLEILPYLMADISSAKDICSGLGLGAEEAEKIHESRRALHRRLREAGCIDWPLSGQTVALAEAALEAGAIWVPLEYR